MNGLHQQVANYNCITNTITLQLQLHYNLIALQFYCITITIALKLQLRYNYSCITITTALQ